MHLSAQLRKKVHRKTRAEQETSDARKRTAAPRPFANGASTVSMLCSWELRETCLKAKTSNHLPVQAEAQVSKQAVQIWKQIKDSHNSPTIIIKLNFATSHLARLSRRIFILIPFSTICLNFGTTRSSSFMSSSGVGDSCNFTVLIKLLENSWPRTCTASIS